MPDELIVKIEYLEEIMNQGGDLFSGLHILNKDFVNGNIRLEARIRIERDSKISLFERLERLAHDIGKCREYNRIMAQLGKWDSYLGNWKNDAYPLRMNVGVFMERAYNFVEDNWGLNKEKIYSCRKYFPLPSIRGGMQYLLKRNFPKLSTTEIGKITKKNHATVILNLERLKSLKVGNPDLIESCLPKIVDYHHRTRKSKIY